MKRCGKRLLGVLLAAVMLLGLLPSLAPGAEAYSAGQHLEVYLGNGRIGNGGYGETDLFVNFVANTGAFTYSAEGGDHALNGNSFRMGRPSDRATFTVTIGNSELLKALSQSSTAQYKVVGKVTGTDDDFHGGTLHDDNDRARLRVGDSRRGTYKEQQSDKEEDAEDTVRWLDTGWQSLTGLSWIKLYADNRHYCDGDYSYSDNCDGDSYVEMWLYIRDTSGPTLTSYTTSTNATVNSNNSKELLVKLGIKNSNDPNDYYYSPSDYNSDSNAMASREWIGFQFNFSKPVSLSFFQGGNLSAVSDDDYNLLASHDLFTNTLGTGYQGQGQNRGLKLEQSKNDLQSYRSNITYRYTATYGDFSGNNPIPNGGNIESGSSLLSKINSAGFHDAAGNPLRGVDGSKGSNIFDRNDGGYDVIVDAVPPTYSRVANGVTPDILTQLVLNENDSVDFIVCFSEATITRRGWDNAKTYLMLNNGDRAYFREKSADGKQWIFRYQFTSGTAEEASLLKVIALANDALNSSLRSDSTGKESRGNDSAYSFNADGRTVTDYVGNFMVERANEDSSTNSSQIESSTTWAGLTVDNTPPGITFSYTVYGAGSLTKGTDNEWGQAAKVMPIAADPAVPVAKYDPDYSSSNTTRPSKGIYRPDNTTGSTASAVGLVFYTWSRNETAPATGDNFAAIKRYSLTGEQPGTVTGADYASAWADYTLMMANNYSEIAPPDEAMTGAGDGAWYLHVWTADMTWDSARQLMQYAKARATQYTGSFDNASFLQLKADSIEAYRKGNAPSYSTAWAAVMPEVYTAVYTSQFLGWLDEATDGRYADASMEYAEKKAAQAAKTAESARYNSGYSAASMSDDEGSTKSNAIAEYVAANTPSEEVAWTAIKSEVYTKAFSSGFSDWLGEDTNDTITLTSTVAEIKALADSYLLNRFPYLGKTKTTTTTVEGKEVETTTLDGYYTADEVAELKADKIAEYKNDNPKTGTGTEEHDTTDEEAWEAVKADFIATVYPIVYTEAFVTYLNGEECTEEKLSAYVAANEAAAYHVKEGETYTAGTGAPGAVVLLSNSVDAYITEQTPTSEDAWLEVREEVYTTVYTAAFLALLDASGYDRYSDAAVEYVSLKEIEAQQYKESYEAAQELKAQKIQAYIAANTSAQPKDPTPSYTDAWNAVKETVYSTAYTSRFLAWLDESGSDRYSDAAMLYAKAQAMLTQAQYENTNIWPLSDFSRADSNWTLATTRLLLDNTPPAAEAVYQVDNMTGNETAAVELPFTVSDATGGIQTNSVYYQWVKVKEDESQTYEEVQWLQVTADQTVDVSGGLTGASYGAASATYTAKTLGNVDGDGEYILYLKYSDVAGNTTVTNSGELRVTVDASNAAVCAFGPETAISGWSKKIVPTFTVSGVAVGRAEYAVTDSTERPTSGFTAISADEEGGASFTLPELDKADGTWYVHVLIYENANQTVEPRYFRQLYRLDRTGPEILFNPDGFTEAQESATVSVSFLDSLAGVADGAVYRISTGTEEIADSEEGWAAVPSSKRITLSAEETGSYYLHVLAEDKAGNATYVVSAAYALRSGSAPASVLPAYGSEILSVYTVDGKTYAAANLFLDTEDKTDYRYSISTDGGETWCNWLPYMSMIRIRLPAEYPAGTLRVKFRGPDGTVGPETNIATLSLDNAIWATAEFDSTFKRQTGKTLTFLMTLPEGVTAEEKVEDGAAAETTKLENGNFTVTANGVYEFALTRGGQTAESTLIVVVDIFDDTAPEGYISYSEVAPTNGSVIAAVKANEPIYVKTLMVKYDGDADYSAETPKVQFSFQRNGTAVFTVVDEAGNERDVTATVKNIDKTGPQVFIGTDYELYETVGTGAELIASGVTLEVRKETSAGEDFTVVNNDQYPTMEVGVNGTYSFIVQDRVGNVTQAQHVVSNVVTTLPDYTVTYTYLDGSPVTEGVWKQDKVVATVTFDAVTDGRKLYGGAAIVDEDRQVVRWNNTTNAGETRTEHVSNELSMSEGKYVYSRTYTANGETSLVVCDSLGNVERIPITVTGIDNTPPTLTLDKSTAVISNDQPKRLPEMSAAERIALLGGYTVTDNVYTDGFAVTVARSDDSRQASNDDKGKLTEVGKFTLIYTVTDPAGNVSYAEQTLIVIPSDGLLIEAGKDGDYALLSGLSANSSILPDNHVTFRIDKARMQAMFYSGDNGRETVHNDMAEYEILYVSGLYREGQLKTIATRVAKTTAAEMGESMTFSITFPKPGWYTIIIRNQERTREYTTFFIAATSGDA